MSYQIADKNGVQYLVIPEMEETGIRHFFTTRKGPQHSAIPFVSQEAFVMVRQVHGDNILVIDKPLDDIFAFIKDAMHKPCDAIITNQKPVGIGIVTADCLPALLYDPVQ
ncbi:MAG: laccase domain-containing protein, partial [Nitrospirae bacterium]|nr:laccase domain-containing protein [Nitrospirota bacterium]